MCYSFMFSILNIGYFLRQDISRVPCRAQNVFVFRSGNRVAFCVVGVRCVHPLNVDLHSTSSIASLGPFAANTPRQLNVFGLDRHALGVDCAEIGVLKKGNEVRFRRFLSEGDRPGTVAMGFLDTAVPRRGLPGSFRRKLLARCFPTCSLARSLLRTRHYLCLGAVRVPGVNALSCVRR